MSRSIKEINRVKNIFLKKIASFNENNYLNKLLKVANEVEPLSRQDVIVNSIHIRDYYLKNNQDGDKAQRDFLSEAETFRMGYDLYAKDGVNNLLDRMKQNLDSVSTTGGLSDPYFTSYFPDRPYDGYAVPQTQPQTPKSMDKPSWNKNQVKQIQNLLAGVALPGDVKPSSTGFMDSATLKAINQFKSRYNSKAVNYDQLAHDLYMANIAQPPSSKQPSNLNDLRISGGGPVPPSYQNLYEYTAPSTTSASTSKPGK